MAKNKNTIGNDVKFLKKTLTVVLVGVFLCTSTLSFAENDSLAPFLRLNNEEFKTSLTVAAICKHIEHDGNLDDKSYLNNVLARLDVGKNPNIIVLPHEVIIEIPAEGLAIRYFDPAKASAITPYSDVSGLSTKVIGLALNRQIIHRIKALSAGDNQSYVAIKKLDRGENPEEIKVSLLEAFKILGGAEAIFKGKNTVLIKPSLATKKNAEDKTTVNPAMIEAVVLILKELGVRRIIIGEGCVPAYSMEEIFNLTGVSAIAERHKVELINLNKAETVEIKVPGGESLQKVKVAKIAAEADLIVNIPRLTTHSQTVMSVATKNMKGVLPPDVKQSFHAVDLAQRIVDLNKALSKQIIVVDATRAMEGYGPTEGKALNLHMVIVGRHPITVDRVCARIIGQDEANIPFLQLAKEQFFGAAPIVFGESVENVVKEFGRPFEEPSIMKAINNPRITVYQDETSCTGCNGSLLAAAKFLGNKKWNEMLESNNIYLDIYMGSKMPETIEDGHYAVLLGIGRCAKNNPSRLKFSHPNAIRVVGCPPNTAMVLDEIEKRIKFKEFNGEIYALVNDLRSKGYHVPELMILAEKLPREECSQVVMEKDRTIVTFDIEKSGSLENFIKLYWDVVGDIYSEDIKKIYEQIASGTDLNDRQFDGYMERFKNDFIDRCGINATDAVLDMGTGAGWMALLAANEAREVIGMDICPAAIGLAIKNASLKGVGNAKFSVGDATRCQFKNESFNVIISQYMFSLLPKELRRRALKEAHRMLTEKGLLRLWVYHPDVAPFAWDQAEWEKELKLAGFEIESVEIKGEVAIDVFEPQAIFIKAKKITQATAKQPAIRPGPVKTAGHRSDKVSPGIFGSEPVEDINVLLPVLEKLMLPYKEIGLQIPDQHKGHPLTLAYVVNATPPNERYIFPNMQGYAGDYEAIREVHQLIADAGFIKGRPSLQEAVNRFIEQYPGARAKIEDIMQNQTLGNKGKKVNMINVLYEQAEILLMQYSLLRHAQDEWAIINSLVKGNDNFQQAITSGSLKAQNVLNETQKHFGDELKSLKNTKTALNFIAHLLLLHDLGKFIASEEDHEKRSEAILDIIFEGEYLNFSSFEKKLLKRMIGLHSAIDNINSSEDVKKEFRQITEETASDGFIKKEDLLDIMKVMSMFRIAELTESGHFAFIYEDTFLAIKEAYDTEKRIIEEAYDEKTPREIVLLSRRVQTTPPDAPSLDPIFGRLKIRPSFKLRTTKQAPAYSIPQLTNFEVTHIYNGAANDIQKLGLSDMRKTIHLMMTDHKEKRVMLNLCDPETEKILSEPALYEELKKLKNIDLFSLHLGFSMERFEEVTGGVSASPTLPDSEIHRRIVANVKLFKAKLKENGFGDREVLLENLGYFPGLDYIWRPDAIHDILRDTGCGLLLDLGHIIVTAQASKSDIVGGSIEKPSEYTQKILDKDTVSKLREIHISIPSYIESESLWVHGGHRGTPYGSLYEDTPGTRIVRELLFQILDLRKRAGINGELIINIETDDEHASKDAVRLAEILTEWKTSDEIKDNINQQSTAGFTLQPLTKEFAAKNVDRLLELQNIIPGVNWTPDMLLDDEWRPEPPLYSGKVFLAKWEHSIVAVDNAGYPIGLLLAYERSADEEMKKVGRGSLYIHGFVVDPERQGNGLGKMMMHQLAENLMRDEFKKISGDPDLLITLRFDKKSSYLADVYAKLGFKKVGEINGKDGHDDFIYMANAIDVCNKTSGEAGSAVVKNQTDYIDANKLLFKDALGSGKQDILLRVPIEAIESIGVDNIKDFLATFQKAPNGYVELYYMSGIGEASESVYQKYDIEKKLLSEELKIPEKRTRKNTLTLFPVLKDEKLDQASVVSRIGNMAPKNTILSPVGLQNDSAGLIRSTILGLKIMEVAREGEKIDKDEVQRRVLEDLKVICKVDDMRGLTADDIIYLAISDDINKIMEALKKLIRLLPIVPINAEELRQIYEHAKKALIAA